MIGLFTCFECSNLCSWPLIYLSSGLRGPAPGEEGWGLPSPHPTSSAPSGSAGLAAAGVQCLGGNCRPVKSLRSISLKVRSLQLPPDVSKIPPKINVRRAGS